MRWISGRSGADVPGGSSVGFAVGSWLVRGWFAVASRLAHGSFPCCRANAWRWALVLVGAQWIHGLSGTGPRRWFSASYANISRECHGFLFWIGTRRRSQSKSEPAVSQQESSREPTANQPRTNEKPTQHRPRAGPVPALNQSRPNREPAPDRPRSFCRAIKNQLGNTRPTAAKLE